MNGGVNLNEDVKSYKGVCVTLLRKSYTGNLTLVKDEKDVEFIYGS